MAGHIVLGHDFLFLDIDGDDPDVDELNSVHNRDDPSETWIQQGDVFSKPEFNGALVFVYNSNTG
jgi:hypothetical protein